MKYQDFSSDEIVVSSEDTIFIFHNMKIYGCYDYFILANLEIIVKLNIALVFHRCLYNKQNITCPLVDTNLIFSCSSGYQLD